ncbi:hypothetical protein ABE10_12580 [Bacillus toyonensis]|nr:hypothetical protein [Bacillus toyonensis]
MARTSSRDRSRATFGEPFALPRKSKRDPHVYVVQGVDHDGSRFQIKRSRPTADAALSAVKDAIAVALDGAAPQAAGRVRMGALFEQWWAQETALADAASRGETAARPLSGATLLKYRGVWKKHLDPVLGNRSVESITHAEVYNLLHEIPKPTTPRDSKPKPLLDVLRVLFRYASGAGIIESHRNPTRGDFKLPSAKPQPRPLTLDELDAIEAHLSARKAVSRRQDPLRLHDSFVVMRSTGARISEILALRASDFDLKTRALTVEEHVARTIRADGLPGSTSQVLPGTKTAAGTRTVVVPQRAAAILAQRSDGKPPEAFLFATSTGSAMATENWRTELRAEIVALNKKRKEEGLPPLTDIHPHRLRATVASTIVKALVERHGVAAGLEAARRQLGHEGISTLRHYVDEAVTVVDHSDVLDELDSVAMKQRAAHQVIERLSRNDPFLGLEVVSSERSVGVVATEPLTEAQRAVVVEALAQHDLRLLS